MKKVIKYFFILTIVGIMLLCFTAISSADKTTYIVDTDDGYIYNMGLDYYFCHASLWGTALTGGNVIYVGQDVTGGLPLTFTIYRTILFFDTSDLDVDLHNIAGANLRFYVQNDISTTDFDITAQFVECRKPPENGDYFKDFWSGEYGSVNTGDIQPYFTSYLEIELTQEWIDNILNYDDYTVIGLRSYQDITRKPPRDSEYVILWSGNMGNSLYRPQLRIYYEDYVEFNSSTWYNYTGDRETANCSVTWKYWEHNDTFDIVGTNSIGTRDYGEGNWRLVSLPKNETVSKFDVYVRNETNNYTFQQAIDNGIILTFLYNWSDEGNYNGVDYFTPYEGFWLWFYDLDYELWINGTVGNGNGNGFVEEDFIPPMIVCFMLGFISTGLKRKNKKDR